MSGASMIDAAGVVRLGRTPARVRGARIDFDRVTKDYGDLSVLQETVLTIGQGEFFALIGPSGSGKSTLLSILAGFVAPSHGAVRIDGRDVVSIPPYRRNIGMVFQNYALFPHMTVAQNIAFPLRLRRLPKAELAAEVAQALAMVRLDALGDRYPAELSGGQQQRVALARAAVYKPGLLLMDEPLGALDKNLREELQEEIKAFQRELGSTVVYVTHDQQEATFLADRLAVMKDGLLEQIGPPRELYERPATSFVANFLGETSLIKLESVVAREQGVLRARACSGLILSAPEPRRRGRSLSLCIRPENIAMGDAAKGKANCFDAEVCEAHYTTGSLRYRVRVAQSDTILTIRVPSHPGIKLIAPGTSLPIGWEVGMSVTLSEA